MEVSKLLSILSKVKVTPIFTLYIIGLFNFVVFKYFGDIQPILERIDMIKLSKEQGYYYVQTTPFKTIATSFEAYSRLGLEPSSYNLIANVLLFVPMGFLLPFILSRGSLLLTFSISFVIIIMIEITQYIANLGIADIDDVILNLLGSIMGYAAYVATKGVHGIKQSHQTFN